MSCACRRVVEVIRWKHNSIHQERAGNQDTQHDAQPEKQKREAFLTSRFAFRQVYSYRLCSGLSWLPSHIK